MERGELWFLFFDFTHKGLKVVSLIRIRIYDTHPFWLKALHGLREPKTITSASSTATLLAIFEKGQSCFRSSFLFRPSVVSTAFTL